VTTGYCAECGKTTDRMDHDELAWLGGAVGGFFAGGLFVAFCWLLVAL
jgi:hypothetical protein